MVRKDLVPPIKWLEDKAVMIKCAHVDTVMYPLASVDLIVEGTAVNVEAALLDTLLAASPPSINPIITQELLHLGFRVIHKSIINALEIKIQP